MVCVGGCGLFVVVLIRCYVLLCGLLLLQVTAGFAFNCWLRFIVCLFLVGRRGGLVWVVFVVGWAVLVVYLVSGLITFGLAYVLVVWFLAFRFVWR